MKRNPYDWRYSGISLSRGKLEKINAYQPQHFNVKEYSKVITTQVCVCRLCQNTKTFTHIQNTDETG